MINSKITQRQCFFLLFLFFIGNLVTASGAKGKPSGWLLFLLLAMLSLPVVYLFMCAAKDRSAGSLFIDSLGKRIGGLFTIIYGILAIMLAGDAMRLFADFIVINDLNDAGAWGNTALLTLTVFFFLKCDIKSLGKAAWLLQPVTVFLLFLGILMTVPKMELHRLLPLFSETPTILVKEGLSSFTAITAAGMLPMILLHDSVEKSCLRPAAAACIAACIILALLALRDTAVLGFPAVSMFRFPSFTASGMLRHSEILIAAVFVLSQPFRTALLLRYAQACLNELWPRWKRIYPYILLGLAILSGALSWSSEQVRWRTAGELIITVILLAGPIAVVVTDRIKARKANA